MKERSDNELIDGLILSGAIEVSAIDQNTGELLYSFTPKIKEIMPNLYKEHLLNVNSEVMNLWEKGFLDIDLMADDPIITITKKAMEKTSINTLSKEEKWSLSEIIRLLNKKV